MLSYDVSRANVIKEDNAIEVGMNVERDLFNDANPIT
jgi:hypothetical protein